MNPSKIISMIVTGDYQIPYHDKLSLAAVEKYMAAHKWDIYLNLGDFLDFDSISDFNSRKPRVVEGKRISDDYAVANEILDRHQEIIRARNKSARFILLEGNHEERMERYLDAFPLLSRNAQGEGMGLEVEDGLRLEKRGFRWVRSWLKGEDLKIGKAHFTHGQYTNKYHAAKMVDSYGDSIFYGHTHDIMCVPKASKLNPDKVIVGQSLGCLCEREQSYMKGRPSNWQQGFGVFFFLPDGKYTYYVARIFDHQFVGPDGVLYRP